MEQTHHPSSRQLILVTVSGLVFTYAHALREAPWADAVFRIFPQLREEPLAIPAVGILGQAAFVTEVRVKRELRTAVDTVRLVFPVWMTVFYDGRLSQ
jgi:hypothetical protein